MIEQQPNNDSKNSKLKKIIKRFGIGGLIFFTAKGIAWLFVFYFGAEMLGSCS